MHRPTIDQDSLGDLAGSPCAVLLSGGLDSAILAAGMLAANPAAQAIYVRSGYRWEEAEVVAAKRFWEVVRGRSGLPAEPLVELLAPDANLSRTHWAFAGQVPEAGCDDLAVDLPGRNARILTAAARWCGRRDITQLAIGVLGTSPFPDASDPYFRELERQWAASGLRVSVCRPLSSQSKEAWLAARGADLPLELTVSCLSPQGQHHCGRCNKCGERRQAFRRLGRTDPTRYLAAPAAASPDCLVAQGG